MRKTIVRSEHIIITFSSNKMQLNQTIIQIDLCSAVILISIQAQFQSSENPSKSIKSFSEEISRIVYRVCFDRAECFRFESVWKFKNPLQYI